jgi:hypothetical protein
VLAARQLLQGVVQLYDSWGLSPQAVQGTSAHCNLRDGWVHEETHLGKGGGNTWFAYVSKVDGSLVVPSQLSNGGLFFAVE